MLKGKVGIIILNHNKNKEIVSIYKQLKNQTYKNFILIVIDDNSDSKIFLDQLNHDNIFIYSYPEKFEFGLVKKYNFALKKALENLSDYIFVLQSDMNISECPNLIDSLVNHLESNQKCVVAGPIMYNGNNEMTWGPNIFKNRMGHLFNVSESFLIRSTYLLKYGLWNDLFIYYGEEMEFFLKIYKLVFTTEIVNNTKVIHYGGGTTYKFQNEKDYHRPRSSILIMRMFNKNDNLLKKITFLNEELFEQKYKLRQNFKKRNFIKILQTIFYLIKGTIEGLFIKIK